MGVRGLASVLGLTGLVSSAALALAGGAMLGAGLALQRAFDPSAAGLAPASWPLWLSGASLAVLGTIVLAMAAGGLVGGAVVVGAQRLFVRARARR